MEDEIYAWIDEFFGMEKGAFISDSDRLCLFAPGIYISRRAVKHIVERRSLQDRLDCDGIKSFMSRAQKIAVHPEFHTVKTSIRHSYLMVGGFDAYTNKGIVIILNQSFEDVPYYVVTIFFQKRSRFFKILGSLKNTS